MTSDPSPPRLRVVELSRSFGAVQALRDVSLDARDDEIHAILGENGAGKSTLMNLIHGALAPDSGHLEWQGRRVEIDSPQAARRLGIGMVHQHFMLVPNFTVAENLALAELENLKGSARIAERGQHAAAVAAELGWDLPLGARTGDLPVGAQQRIEILKALGGNAPLLILDEPTAVLSEDEVGELFRVLRQLRDRGRCILLIAHKLSEIMAIADRVTVLREGRFVATAALSETDGDEIARWMTGSAPEMLAAPPTHIGESVLTGRDVEVRGDRGEMAVRGVSVDIRAGEIVGFGGVDGNGQVELAEALAGVRPLAAGKVTGSEYAGYISQDRQADGLAMAMSIRDNLLVGGLRKSSLFWRGWMRTRAIRTWAEQLVNLYRIRIGGLANPVSSLSGGNQQKVIVSRTLDQNPRALVAVNPTRGLDFAATTFVHAQLLEAARTGCGVALFSTDREELAALCHRVVTLSRGEIA